MNLRQFVTLITLGFLKIVFFWGKGQFDPPFMFQEELVQIQYNFVKLLSNLSDLS